MTHLMAALGEPHRRYPVVHVTGTNGKTSTARMVGALLGAHGLCVGVTTSPHLVSPTERLTIGGRAISEEALAGLMGQVAGAGSRGGGDRAGYFEALTAAAFAWFAEREVDAAVVEVGIGGRYDATNVVSSEVAVVTNVGLDHVEILGPSRADIAWDKSGIVKAGSTLVLAEEDPELAPIFGATPAGRIWKLGRDFACDANLAASNGREVTLRTPSASYERVNLGLHGAYQGVNAACAVAAAEALVGAPLSEEVVRAALGGVTSPGRMELMGVRPWLILDGAKNPSGALAAARAIAEEFAVARSRILVVGMLAGRDPHEMLSALGAATASLVVATAPDDRRALPARVVGDAAQALGVRTVVAEPVGQAVDMALAEAAPEDLVLVSGSLYVVGEARSHLVASGMAAEVCP
ncbi:MAG: bifunctional folylpolyglutamate synthase/dihydrofolate synthase [Acidimicrobiales bacterium]